MTIQEMMQKAKAATFELGLMTTEQKNKMLFVLANALEINVDAILNANKIDLENAKGKISDVMLDRLTLTSTRIQGMADGIREVVKLPDPIGIVEKKDERPNGLIIEKKRVPMGVIAIVYESRPNVTSDAAALTLKSGNVCILRGGKEAFQTSSTIIKIFRNALKENGFNQDFIHMPEDTSHESVNVIMKANDYVDLLIPRGGAGLIRTCVENATVPCIQTGTGICHIYVDDSADIEMAVSIVNNAKTSRPSVCNAEEVLLVHENIAKEFLPKLEKVLVNDRIQNGKIPVELRLCEKAQDIIPGTKATEKDFNTEFLDYILAVKIVKDVKEAVKHIAIHSTHHSEAIITNTENNAEYFTGNVDSAAVYVNASTRFTDGGEFGLGCEIGISTQKMHARGPMGLEELTTYKYVIHGNGQVR